MELWKRRQSTAAMKWGVEGDTFIINTRILCFLLSVFCFVLSYIIYISYTS
jgi:hypothetical protein